MAIIRRTVRGDHELARIKAAFIVFIVLNALINALIIRQVQQSPEHCIKNLRRHCRKG